MRRKPTYPQDVPETRVKQWSKSNLKVKSFTRSNFASGGH
jgi:hypothetical protein